MPVFETSPTGSANGGPVLLFNEALYECFKAALLGTGSIVIGDGKDEHFEQRQRRSLEKNPYPKHGHWVQVQEIVFSPTAQGHDDWKMEGYKTTLKFIPPIDSRALGQCMDRFRDEFGLEAKQGWRWPENLREHMRKHPGNGDPDKIRSRVAIQSMPGGTEETIIIQIPSEEFEKIRARIVVQNAERLTDEVRAGGR